MYGCITWVCECMYGCMNVCIDVWVYVWVHGCIVVWVYGCMSAWVYGRMGAWVHGCMGFGLGHSRFQGQTSNLRQYRTEADLQTHTYIYTHN